MTCTNRGFLLPSVLSSVPVLCNAVFVLSGLLMVRQRLSSSWKQMRIANWSFELGLVIYSTVFLRSLTGLR